MTEAASLLSFFAAAEPTGQRPWPGYRLNRTQWQAMAERVDL